MIYKEFILKKVILIFCIVFGLAADDVACKYYDDKFDSHYTMYGFALEKRDFSSMALYNSLMLEYVELSIADCTHIYDRDTLILMRESILESYKVLEKYR